MRIVAGVWLWLALLAPVHAEPVEVSVLGLFHATRLDLETAGVRVDGVALSAAGLVRIELRGNSVMVRTAAGERSGSVAETSGEFTLGVPDKLERRYRGELRIEPHGDELLAVISMDLETALAAVLAKEAKDEPHAEALAAQAIVSRSFLAAGRRHQRFDFCDTTHCQWLGETPVEDSPIGRAAQKTRGLVLLAQNRPVQALFSPRCGGRTRTLAQIGFEPKGYPFYAVDCRFCRRRPDAWQRTLSAADAGEILETPGLEAARLAVVRRLGWNVLPSNAYRITRRAERLDIRGNGAGHGAGLCQAGAGAMAARGLSAREILRVYFPNTAVGSHTPD